MVELSTLCCPKKSRLGDALKKIDINTKSCIFVTDENDKLCGILTDGDVRRSLLNGYGLNDEIVKFMHDDFVFAYSDESADTIASKFNNKIKIIPIVDRNMKIVDYSEFDDNAHISLANPQLNGNEYRYLMDAFLSTWISSSGKYVDGFEESFSRYCGTKFGVATANGTVALHLALVALGIGEGDEVIVPDLTFAATINAVLYTGATPVIVDIDEESWCIDPKAISNAITVKTKAIIPVHLYGQPCDMETICKIAEEHDLYIVEDCAEAHGAEFNNKKVGGFGVISCFSFYGNKVITTGEGGMCLTNDENLFHKMRLYRDHGMSKNKRYYHEIIGFNYRMTNMQAAIGKAQVEHIEDILSWRHGLEDIYRSIFSYSDRIVFQRNDLKNRKKITWLISILVGSKKQDVIVRKLKENNIDVRTFFYPLSDMSIYKKYTFGEMPVSHKISKRGINLPTTYNIDRTAVEKIYRVIISAS